MTNPLVPPSRQALADEELAKTLEQIQAVSGPLAGIEFLQDQTLLRASDEAAFATWVKQMEALGTVEALVAVDSARREHLGLGSAPEIETPSSSHLVGDLAALGDWQQRALDAENQRLSAQQREAQAAAAEAEASRQREERAAALEQERIEAERAELERLAIEIAELEAQAQTQIQVLAEPEPNRASDFATGSFEIVESLDAATETFDEVAFATLADQDQLHFAPEQSESFSIKHIVRRSKSISQLFVWSGISAGLLPILIGFLAAEQATPAGPILIALLAGYLVSATLIATTAIAGKRSGLQSTVLSRAAFGVSVGKVTNWFALIAKLVLGTLLIAALISFAFNHSVAGLPELSQSVGPDLNLSWLLVLVASFGLLALVPAFLGGRVLFWTQLVSAALGLVAVTTYLIAALPFANWSAINWFDRFDQPQLAAMVALAGLLTAGFGAFWASSAADFARRVPMSEPGKKVALFVFLGAGVLPLLLSALGVVIAKSSSLVAKQSDLDLVLRLLASVDYRIGTVLLVGLGVSIFVWLSSWLNSTSVELRASGLRMNRWISQSVVLVAVLAISAIATLFDISIIRSTAQVLFVILLAHIGVVVGDVWRRKAAYHESSLVNPFGIYGAVRIANLIGFIAASIIGLGFTSTDLDDMYLTNFIGQFIPAVSWADAQAGMIFAFVIAALVAVAFGGKAIRAQEQQVVELEQRKTDLVDVNPSEIF